MFLNTSSIDIHSQIETASRVTMPRVIYAGERVRAAGEHADDILLAAQVLEGHHAAAAHHHFERLVARPRLDHDPRVHRIGSRAALLVVSGRQMDSAAHVWVGVGGVVGSASLLGRVDLSSADLDTSGGSPRALRPFEFRLRPSSMARSRISRLSERLPVQVRRAKGSSSGCATMTTSMRWCTPRGVRQRPRSLSCQSPCRFSMPF